MSADPKTATLRIALPARAENVAVIRHALAGMAIELGAEEALVDDIKTAVSEAANNVVVHAYPEGTEGPIEVVATAWGQRLEVVIRDRGVGMHPAPLGGSKQGLRVGMSLIGALADGFEIRGDQNRGTEVRISFDISPDADRAWITDTAPQVGGADETIVSVQGTEPGGVAITRVLELLAARSNLPLDRFSDAQLIGDVLAQWSDRATVDSQPLEIAFGEAEESLEIRIGPLEPGRGEKMLERDQLPGLGNTLESLADVAEVGERDTSAGPAEFLTLRIGSTDPTS